MARLRIIRAAGPAAEGSADQFDRRGSASGLPPVWQVGRYCRELSAKDTSRTVSPHTGRGRPVRACAASPLRFSDFRVAARWPAHRVTAWDSVWRIAVYRVLTWDSVNRAAIAN